MTYALQAQIFNKQITFNVTLYYFHLSILRALHKVIFQLLFHVLPLSSEWAYSVMNNFSFVFSYLFHVVEFMVRDKMSLQPTRQ